MRIVWLLLLLSLPAFGEPLDGARALIDQGRYTEAQTVLQTTLDDAELKGRGLVLLTRLHNEQQDYRQGIEYGKQAIELLPDSSAAHHQYAVALRHKMIQVSKFKAMFVVGDYKRELRRAIELDPGNLDAREEEIGFLREAPSAVGGSRERALERIEELKRLDWNRGMASLVELHRAEEEYEDAQRVCDELLEAAPGYVRARLSLGFLYQQQERFRDADREFTSALESEDVEDALMARYQLARSKILGRYEAKQAVDHLRAYIDAVPQHVYELPSKSNAYWRLGNAHEQLNQPDQARRAYRQAVELDGGNKEARKALSKLSDG